MANKKITGLTELTAVASGDYLEIVDTSGSGTMGCWIRLWGYWL